MAYTYFSKSQIKNKKQNKKNKTHTHTKNKGNATAHMQPHPTPKLLMGQTQNYFVKGTCLSFCRRYIYCTKLSSESNWSHFSPMNVAKVMSE